MRPPDDPTAWARLLRSAAGDLPPIGARLGAGLIDAALLRCIHDPSPTRAPDAADPAPTPPGSNASGNPTVNASDVDSARDRARLTLLRPEERIWRWVHDDDPALESLLLLGEGPLLPPPVPIGGLAWRESGEAAWAQAGWRAERWTIETWTEAELSALQATLHRACADGGGKWLRRIASARRWHLEHTQPDNATNRPWAIPVFLAPAVTGSGGAIEWGPASEVEAAESRLYAETLLHNAMSQAFGAPNPLCAAILHDAASLLDPRA